MDPPAMNISTSSLPAELWIQIFSYLPVPSLVAVSSVSKAFHAFFNDPQNGSPIWRNACLLHGLVGYSTVDSDADGQVSVEAEPPRREWGRWRDWERKKHANALHGDVKWSDLLDLYSEQSLLGALDGGVNWKGLVKRRLRIHRSWSGQLPSDVVHYVAEETSFARSTARSPLAMLHEAKKLLETLPSDNWSVTDVQGLSEKRLKSPTKAMKRRLKMIKAVLGFPEGHDDTTLVGDTTYDLLLMETQWGNLLRSELPSALGNLVPSTKNVHRIKVDERNGFVVTTHRDGGLVVTDIHTKEIRWCLPKLYVHEYAHLEYEQGYIVFDRTDGSKEVWRSSSISAPSSISMPAQEPDKQQRVAAAFASGDDDGLLKSLLTPDSRLVNPTVAGVEWGALAPTAAHTSGEETRKMGIKEYIMAASWFRFPEGSRRQTILGWVNLDDLRRFLGRGDETLETQAPKSSKTDDGGPRRLSPQFVPHMVIPVPHDGDGPDMTRAYRFVYPYLLAASQTRAYVWDIRTGEQAQVVSSIQQFSTPERYPVPPDTPPPTSGGPASDKGKARAEEEDGLMNVGDEVDGDEVEVDGNFPVYRPFKSGVFDQNATYSDNFVPSSNRNDEKPHSSISVSPSDPLSIGMNPPHRLGHIFYVELSERWIFVCGGEGLRLFSRGKEFFDHSDLFTRVKRNLGYDLGPGQLALRVVADRVHYARWHASVGKESFREHWGSELVRQQVVWDKEVQLKGEEEANRVLNSRKYARRAAGPAGEGQPASRRLKLFDEVIAVHVSPDQKHFAALLSSSRLLFVPDFEKVIAGEESVWDSGVEIQLGPVKVQSVYLSYGGGESGSGGSAGRISVVTEAGIFVVTPFFNQPGSPPGRKVDITVHRLAPSFMDTTRLRDISCLQMSDTGLWVNWHVPNLPKPPPLSKAIKRTVGTSHGSSAANPNYPYASGLRTEWLVENGYLPSSRLGLPSGEEAYEHVEIDATLPSRTVEAAFREDDDEEVDDEALEPYPGDDSDDAGVMHEADDIDSGDGWEDVDEDEDRDEDEGEDSEEERDIFDEGPNAGLYPGDQYFTGASSSLRGPETFTFTRRRGKTWKTSSWYPKVAMEVPDAERIQARAAKLDPSLKPADIPAPEEQGKGKQREPLARWSSLHPDNGPRWWVTQLFPLNDTPPSQYAVEGGPCKWNNAERTGEGRRSLSVREKTAINLDIAFGLGLGKARVDKWGNPGDGTMTLADGDLMVRTESEDFPRRMARRRGTEGFEVHQIRFIPL